MRQRRFFGMAVALTTLFAAAALMSCSSSSNPTSSGGNPSPNTINISGFAFSPAGKSIAVGTKITWVNKDNATHTVTSDNSAFTSSGNLAVNQTYEFTFTAAGSYPYHCAIHPTMTGTIMVTP